MTERDQYEENQKRKIKEAAAAESFEESDSGRLFKEYLQNTIANAMKDLMSDKFVNDHNGYLEARLRAKIAGDFLDLLKSKAAQGASAKEKLELSQADS